MVRSSPLRLAIAIAAVPAAGFTAAAEEPDEATLVARCVELLLGAQEGDGEAEWPYEGVYRVQGRIPIGYRVGGTAIVALSLLQAPGYQDDEARRASLRRATSFIVGSIDHPLMVPDVSGRYDVRGWGYTYGLSYLLALRRLGLTPDGLAEDADAAIEFFIGGLQATSIPESGGWNYARSAGFDRPGPASPFMTAPTLLALYDARAQGFVVDAEIVEAGLAALARGRTEAGGFDYASGRSNRRSRVPGAVGRMAAAETALLLAGRSSADRLRGAIDAFLVHWGRLEERRSQRGTHAGPYGIAPYYFFFGHYYAALAIELLPERERGEYRLRLRERLRAVQADEGSFNDRVFPRSASYGTAMALLCLLAPDAPALATWRDEGP